MTESDRKTEDENSMGIPREMDKGISFFAIVLGLVHHRQVVLAITGVVVVLGLLKALLSPSLYTATALVVREAASGNISPGLSGRTDFSGLGISMGDRTGGVTPETYPDILRSREVLLAVAKSPFFIKDLDVTMKLIEYYNRPPSPFRSFLRGLKSVTIGLPKTIAGFFKKKSPGKDTVTESGERIFSAVEEEKIARLLAGNLSVNVDPMSGVMSISYTSTNPRLSAQIAHSFIDHLKMRVQGIYTYNSEEKLTYFRNRLNEADHELAQSEKILAKFIDSNWDPKTAKLQTELERLKRQVTFKTELYSHLQTQLAQVELELKRNQPVITVLQAPIPPILPSAPKRKRIVILSLILGGLAGIVAVVIKIVFEKRMANEESRAEWLEIKKIVSQSPPVRWMRRFRIKSDAK